MPMLSLYVDPPLPQRERERERETGRESGEKERERGRVDLIERLNEVGKRFTSDPQ